jgi:hypothetical protein
LIVFAALPISVGLAAQDQPATIRADKEGATNPVPFINQPLIPDAVAPGGPAFTLTVNGTGFVSTSVVKWNGSSLVTTFVNGSQLTASVPASDITTAGTNSVTVVNPSPGGGTSNVALFEVTFSGSAIAFGAPSVVYTGSVTVASVAVADLNGDGIADLVVANGGGGSTLSVLLGNGSGTFQTAVNYDTGFGARPNSVAFGDFNGDGKLDIVAADAAINDVSVLLGNGDGTFQPFVQYGTGSEPISVAVGDLNRDGKLDLVVANYGDQYGAMSVLLGNGDGTFQPARNYDSGSFPVSVAVGDFNGDGILDLAVAHGVAAGFVSIQLGAGDGTFPTSSIYYTDAAPVSVAVGDFNGDGKLDLATANFSSNDLSVLLGNGDGTFQSSVNYLTSSLPSNPTAVAVGDLNGDGKLDLVVANSSNGSSNNGTLSFFVGRGNGVFLPHMDYTDVVSPNGVALADFNGDGRLDFAFTDSYTAAASVLLQASTVLLSKTAVTFANQLVGTTSATQKITLTNNGYLTLTITGVALTGSNATDFSQTNNCPSSLAVHAKCTISVTFTPSQTGPRTASLAITDNAAGSPQPVALSGTGIVSGFYVSLAPASLTFATQLQGTTSPVQSVTLGNYGTKVLSISGITIKGSDPGDFAETNACGRSLASGASCAISVTFKPTQSGSRTATLEAADNAPRSPQTVSLTGTGTVVELSTSSLSFSCFQVCPPPSQTTTLTNVGSITLNITSVAITGSSYFSETNTCGTGVRAGKSCTITVTFNPKVNGTYTGDVSITDDGGGSPQQVSLSGTRF